MLLNLNIGNFAVFEKESVKFDTGFNVFTGETGAGKSVLIDAIMLIMGERASKDLIRKGKKSAVVEALFDISENLKVQEKLNEIGITVDDGDFLIISREILESGKSINKINGRVVPLNTIKEIGGRLVDVYGQFGSASLFKKENHIAILDSVASSDIIPTLNEYNALYKQYKDVCAETEYLAEKLINKDMRLEQLQYEYDEIENADIKEDEEEELLREVKKLSNVQDIKAAVSEACEIMSSSEISAVNGVNSAYSLISKVQSYDEDGMKEFLPKLDIILDELHEFTYSLIDYSDNLDVDEERLALIESRVSLINRIKRKYGYTLEKVMEYKRGVEEEIKLLKDAESRLDILSVKKTELVKKLNSTASKITDMRKSAGTYLEKAILKELDDLNMKSIMFKVCIEKKESYSPGGMDTVEFLIATNAGSDLNSVQKVVSGGEASRIMLALKKIGSEIDSIDTLVFDEIDTGISGKTSQMAGIKMKYIAISHQVICITHSPQIASISKNHYLIEKSIEGGSTYSHVKKLGAEDKVHEIARMLSGMNITEKSLGNARELIESSSGF